MLILNVLYDMCYATIRGATVGIGGDSDTRHMRGCFLDLFADPGVFHVLFLFIYFLFSLLTLL